MPTVPRAQQTQVSNVSSARVRVSGSAEDFGAAEARSLNRVGNAFQKRATEIKTQQDQDAAKEAFTRASDELRGFLHGENGVYSKNGRDAFDSVQLTDTEMANISSKAGEVLSTDQKKMFDTLWGQRRETSLNGVSRYEAGQRKVYTQQATAALNKDALDNAVNNYTDPGAIQDSLDTIELNARTSGEGLDIGATDEQIASQQSNIHKAVIDRMLVNDPQMAQEYYDTNKDRIDGEAHTGIEAALKKRSIAAESQLKTDEIMASGGTASEQMSAARNIDDPEIRDNVVSRVKLRQTEETTIKAREDKEDSETLWIGLETAMDQGQPLDVLEQIRDSGPTRAVRAAMDKVIKDAASGKDIDTDWNKYYYLRELSWTSPSMFKSMNLIEFYGDLATPEREKLIDIQQGIGSDGDSAGRSLNLMVTTEMTAAGILTEGDSKEEADAKKSAVWRGVEKDLREFKDIHKADADRKQTQEIIDRNLEEFVLPESGLFGTSAFQETVRGFELSTGNFDVSFGDVPEKDKQQITEARRKAGLPVSKESIIETYKQGLARNARQ